MSTIYIDPQETVDGSGTELSPRNVWPATASNTTYLSEVRTMSAVREVSYDRTVRVVG
jgi:hypothetical protein